MQDYMRVIVRALKLWTEDKLASLRESVENLTATADNEEILDLLIENDSLAAVADADGTLLSTEGNVIMW